MKELVPEWLQVASQSGRVAPPFLLPDLLDLARSSLETREVILPLLGERGRWLAELNPDWRSVAGVMDEDLEKTWELGSFPARLEALREIRAQDAAKALALLQSTWAQEDGRERSRFLEVLESNLSSADEPFLESTLDDKRSEVRDVARALLRLLPDSRFVQRMWSLAQSYISFAAGQLQLALPEKYDKAWKRDGIQEKLPAYESKIGERAYWLRQIVEQVPPSYWVDSAKVTPEVLVSLANGEWQELLFKGWREAAIQSRDVPWLELFLRLDLESGRREDERLIRNLPLDRAQLFIIGLLESANEQGKHMDSSHMLLLRVLPHPWSQELSRKVLRMIYKEIQRQEDPRQSHAPGHLAEIGLHSNPYLLHELKDFWPEDHPHWPNWQPHILNLMDKLHFRHEMLQELTS